MVRRLDGYVSDIEKARAIGLSHSSALVQGFALIQLRHAFDPRLINFGNRIFDRFRYVPIRIMRLNFC